MPTAEERLSLVLEASDKASAIVQKVRKEVEATTDASNRGAKSGKDNAEAMNELGGSSLRVKELGKQMAGVAFAVNEARLGSKGAVVEVASLVATAAEGTSAFAAWAPEIALGVVLLGTALSLVMDTKREETELANFRNHMQGKSLTTLQQIAEQTRQAREHNLKVIDESQLGVLDKAVGYLGRISVITAAQDAKKPWWARPLFEDSITKGLQQAAERLNEERETFEGLTRNNTENEDANRAVGVAREAERMRLIALRDQSAELARQHEITVSTAREQLALVRGNVSATQAEQQAAKANLDTQNLSVLATFRHRDAQGNLVALTAEEVAERGRLLALNRESYNLTVEQVKEREKLKIKDALFDVNTRLASIREQIKLEQGQSDAFQAQRLSAKIAYEKDSEANKRSGQSSEFRAAQEERILAIYMGQLDLLEQIQKRTERAAHASRLTASDNPAEAIAGRLEQIQLEKEAEIAAGHSVAEATANAEQKKRQLIRQTMTATADSLKNIETLTEGSNNNMVKAAHQFAKNYRAVIIGAKAAEAAIDSARAFASIPAHLAVQDYSGAVLAGLAGTQLAAAAVLGFVEAGGGSTSGGGGAGGGGGGSTTGSSSTFTPATNADAAQPLVVNLYTLHPSDPQLVDSVAFELRKGELLKRPQLQTPPAIMLGASGGR